MPIDLRAPLDTISQARTNPLGALKTGLTNPVNRFRNMKRHDILIDNQSPAGIRQREKLSWRVPGRGLVEMYINPQQLVIQEKKIISKQRTKGGYIIQYWGEELASIAINGHTGSSGIEGINILRSVYRAEQESFQDIAQLLTDRLREFTSTGSTGDEGNAPPTGSTGEGNASPADSITRATESILGKGPNPSLLPTLGSLATSIELRYQGIVFKGFFENFSVTEAVTNGIGIFNYSMNFTVLDRRGERTNFMPWHRSPLINDARYTHSDSNSTPMSFGDEEDPSAAPVFGGFFGLGNI